MRYVESMVDGSHYPSSPHDIHMESTSDSIIYITLLGFILVYILSFPPLFIILWVRSS